MQALLRQGNSIMQSDVAQGVVAVSLRDVQSGARNISNSTRAEYQPYFPRLGLNRPSRDREHVFLKTGAVPMRIRLRINTSTLMSWPTWILRRFWLIVTPAPPEIDIFAARDAVHVGILPRSGSGPGYWSSLMCDAHEGRAMKTLMASMSEASQVDEPSGYWRWSQKISSWPTFGL